MRKGAPVDRSLEKAPHSPAGSCSALVLLVQCWWSSCPPPPPPKNTPATPHGPPNCPPCAGALLTAWTPDPGIWRPEPEALLSNVLHSWGSAGVGSAASCSHTLPADSLHPHVTLLDWCGQAENGQKYEVRRSKTWVLIYVW